MPEQPPPPSGPAYPTYPGDDGRMAAPGYRPTSPLAVVALVCAILGPLVVTLVVAVVLAVIVLVQQRDGKASGTGMAIVALVISAAWAALLGLGTAIVVANDGFQDEDSSRTGGGRPSPDVVTYAELAVGDCLLDSVAGTDLLAMAPRPCSQSHALEVYDDFTLPAGAYPGDEKVSADAEAGCVDRFEAFVGTTYDESQLVMEVIRPLEEAWSSDRLVTCLVGTDGRTFGTLRGSRE